MYYFTRTKKSKNFINLIGKQRYTQGQRLQRENYAKHLFLYVQMREQRQSWTITLKGRSFIEHDV